MRHYKAFQRADDKRWDYTSGGRAIGYCAKYKRYEIKPIFGIDDKFIAEYEGTKHKHHTDGHATAAEAYECYKEYQLDHNLRFKHGNNTGSQLNRCRECKVHTDGYATIGDYNLIHLCKEHQTREVVAKHVEIGESWEN